MWPALRRSLLSVSNLFVATLGLALSLATWWLAPDSFSNLEKIFFAIIILLVYGLVVMIRALYILLSDSRLPNVLRILDAPGRHSDATALVLLTPTQLFAVGTAVSIFRSNDGLELLIGWGEVMHIQGDGKIQVLARQLNGEAKTWQLIRSDEISRSTLIVKPSIPSYVFAEIS